jgi:hypothetical protein
MKVLRIIAVAGALALMIGEAYRSWGAGRPVAFWMDDMLAGVLLIGAAVALRRETMARRALFSGAWGVSVGMLYGSFFGKVFAPQDTTPGNFGIGVLTVLVGVAFAIAIIGFIWSLMAPYGVGRRP